MSFERDYLNWIIDNVDVEYRYRNLLTVLHNIPFKWDVPLDRNRALDGIRLRKIFAKDFGGTEKDLDIGGCTVLEMLFALALEMENSLLQSAEFGDRTADWFWVMIYNLELGGFDDDHWTSGDDKIVRDRIELWLSKGYDSDGFGGLFPIRNPTVDQRTIDIWRQVNAYVMENFRN